jgi:hypothetical protein
MRKVISLAFVFANLSLVACSFSMHAGSDPQHPTPPPPATTPAAPAANPATPAAQPAGRGLMGRHRPSPTPSSTSTAPAPAPTTPPSGAAVVTTPTLFGGPTPDPNGFKGSLFFIPAGTTNVPPNLGSMTPNGFLFASRLNINSQAFTTGFPGVDPGHTTNFAIRYEAPLIVTTEADYDFRVSTDDGAILSIDGTPIVNNDGVKSAAADKDGPVHLVAGTHLLTVDYFQTSGNVALQVFCKKADGAEQICPTHL